ncbi:hypothetical protein SDRG_14110 [Saprolegnia diclina VS20]|uniref:Fungal lipase-like domain-containing protein n=1 Tax=Saprolegnia diclina (strain VS20) TaxID=1156394 RepID=T0R7T1_SAPDV|nr:hypothetical protein SDRG_14110 [Saprolegnia diclina VS20]EQC28153.1 hypothetical protein SDRG_14110 [Saprolegnia diclina VS20]|eukprot:XP_008618439.1 hypothetical protein SDRG_14110 [Saprolegnia diclina VS20]
MNLVLGSFYILLTMVSALLHDDAMDLIAKGRLTTDEWDRIQTLPIAAEAVTQLVHLELDDMIADAIDVQPTDQTLSSDVKVAVVGGALGFVNALLRLDSTPRSPERDEDKTSPVIAAISGLKDATLDSAYSWMDMNRAVRRVNWLKLVPFHGDVATSEHIVVTIDGFMSHGRNPRANWDVFCQSDAACYAVEWEAGNVGDIIDCVGRVLTIDSLASQITKNPWNSAQNKAHQVGAVLAELFLSKPALFAQRKVTVVGHSLGGAVVASLLDHLASGNEAVAPEDRVYLHQAMMFAAAFVPHHDFSHAAAYVFPDTSPARIVNVFSTKDAVLKHVFRLGSIHVWPSAAGCVGIQSPWLQSVDVTDIVPVSPLTLLGHLYEAHMDEILDRLRRSSLYDLDIV